MRRGACDAPVQRGVGTAGECNVDAHDVVTHRSCQTKQPTTVAIARTDDLAVGINANRQGRDVVKQRGLYPMPFDQLLRLSTPFPIAVEGCCG